MALFSVSVMKYKIRILAMPYFCDFLRSSVLRTHVVFSMSHILINEQESSGALQKDGPGVYRAFGLCSAGPELSPFQLKMG